MNIENSQMNLFSPFDPWKPILWKNLLPKNCYNQDRKQIKKGAIIHYFSAFYANRGMWYNPKICRELFIDLNLPVYSRNNHWAAQLSKRRIYASAHYLIDRLGLIQLLVPPEMYAYHAGYSRLMQRNNCNDFCIGIELIAAPFAGEGYDFTDPQYKSAAWLCRNYDLDLIAGHDTVRELYKIKYNRGVNKTDPGNTFDWNKFHQYILNFKAGTYNGTV